MSLLVYTFYGFVPLDPAPAAAMLRATLDDRLIRGTVHVTPEGLNGTLSVPAAQLDGVRATLIQTAPASGHAWLNGQTTPIDTHPFGRLRVRLKREVVSLGLPGIGPSAMRGTRIAPADWNDVLRAGDVAVIDARNAYEVAAGTFAGAINPHTNRFRDFPGWFRTFRAEHPAPRIAMFCTGGIRCEKASALLLALGEPEVLQLEGGIIAYLREVPPAQSLWHGRCFVFDERESVGPPAG